MLKIVHIFYSLSKTSAIQHYKNIKTWALSFLNTSKWKKLKCVLLKAIGLKRRASACILHMQGIHFFHTRQKVRTERR